jgi:hypothetical protein
MTSLRRLERIARTAARTQSAIHNPRRFARNRAKSYALREFGFSRIWRRFWRA